MRKVLRLLSKDLAIDLQYGCELNGYQGNTCVAFENR
jgi:hypothetical protein